MSELAAAHDGIDDIEKIQKSECAMEVRSDVLSIFVVSCFYFVSTFLGFEDLEVNKGVEIKYARRQQHRRKEQLSGPRRRSCQPQHSECGCVRLDFMALATLKDAGFAG